MASEVVPVSKGGIFGNLVKLEGTTNDVASAASAITGKITAVLAAVKEVAKLLPEGELKTFMTDPKKLFERLKAVLFGRKYTSQQYALGERFVDQIQGGNITNRYDVEDSMVGIAQIMFTILFGVRITTQDDLDALQSGVNAYYARPDKKDIPPVAVKRAVFLKQNFYPDSTYNVQKWPLDYFEKYPLVAPIPGIDPNTKYTGTLPGGAYCVQGLIPVDANSLLSQNIAGMGSISSASLEKYAPFIAIALVLGLIISIKTGLFKP
jgi:hypothetical protein